MASNIQDSIVLFGDSLTQGSWDYQGLAARLAHTYVRKFDVLNRGFGGYNTEWSLPVLEKILAKTSEQAHAPRVRLLVIWFGANDGVLPDCLQYVPLARFGENLSTMVRMVRSSTSQYYSPETKIILIAPPPVNVPQRAALLALEDPPQAIDRSFESTKVYAEELLRVAEREGVPVVDAWTLVWEAAGKDEAALEGFLYDGLHVNEEGYKVIFDGLLDTIKTRYPDLHREGLESVFPTWRYFEDHSFEEFKAQEWVSR